MLILKLEASTNRRPDSLAASQGLRHSDDATRRLLCRNVQDRQAHEKGARHPAHQTRRDREARQDPEAARAEEDGQVHPGGERAQEGQGEEEEVQVRG